MYFLFIFIKAFPLEANHMKKLFFALLLAVCTTFGSSLQAQELKIGYTNAEEILASLKEFKQVRTDLETYQKQIEAQLSSKQKELTDKINAYKTGRVCSKTFRSLRDKPKTISKKSKTICWLRFTTKSKRPSTKYPKLTITASYSVQAQAVCRFCCFRKKETTLPIKSF
jgi:formate dehydrogenase assembly factor FdhD